jgi:flagellar basal body P-ring formation protein FlgA
MMFRRINTMFSATGAAILAMVMALVTITPALAAERVAVVPRDIIYPGEPIADSKLEVVPVTNPNLGGGYASDVSEVSGMLSTKTLLPGRTIPLAVLKKPYAVTRGSKLRLVVNVGNLTISAGGSPMEDANIGDVIRVRNLDSGQIVNGTVMADGTVQVMAK